MVECKWLIIVLHRSEVHNIREKAVECHVCAKIKRIKRVAVKCQLLVSGYFLCLTWLPYFYYHCCLCSLFETKHNIQLESTTKMSPELNYMYSMYKSLGACSAMQQR